jgi:hypothetical protein
VEKECLWVVFGKVPGVGEIRINLQTIFVEIFS